MRARQRERQRSVGENEDLLKGARFRANLTQGIGAGRGKGVPVFVRSTSAWEFDNEGKLVTVPAGAARARGARMVRNLISKSEDFSDSSWTKSNVLAFGSGSVANAAMAPDGTMTADLIVEDTTTSVSHYVQHPAVTISTAGECTFSVYAKRAGCDFVVISIQGFFTWFDLLNGVVGTNSGGTTAHITSVGNGWYRCSISRPITTGNNFGVIRLSHADAVSTFTGDGVSGLYLWGAQLENVTGQADKTSSEYVSVGERLNWLTYTNDFSNAVWAKTNVTVTSNAIANPIDGTTDATTLTCASSAATVASQTVTGAGSVTGALYSIYIKKGSGTADANKFIVRNATTASVICSVTVDYDSAGLTILSGEASLTDVGNGWFRLLLWSSTGFSDGDQVQAYACFTGGAETSGEYAYVYAPQLARGVTPPVSYFAVGASYDPYGSGLDSVRYFSTNKDGTAVSPSSMLGYLHEGSRQNNCKYNRNLTVGSATNATQMWITPQQTAASELITNGTFTTDTSGWTASQSTLSVVAGAMRVTISTNGLAAYGRQAITTEVGKTYTAKCTLVTDAAAAALYLYVGTTVAGNDLGSIIFSAPGEFSLSFVATTTTTYINLLAHTSGAVAGEYGEFDNVSVKESMVQGALTATGIDNQANAATTLTAADTNATILQTFSAAAAARTFSAYVKRRTGSGTISITRDGGTGWTDITAQINSSTYSRVAIKNTSVLNPTFGFRLSTTGDAIDVDYCQDEAGTFPSSPIFCGDTSVTRNADSLIFPHTGNFSDAEGTLTYSQTLGDVSNSSTVYAISTTTSESPCYKGNSGGFVGTHDGTSGYFGAAWTTDLNTRKAAGTWETGLRKICLDGGSVGSSAAYDGSFNSVVGLNIGLSSTTYLYGHVKDLAIWDRAFTNAELQRITEA